MAIKKGLPRIGITYDLRQDYLAQGFSEEETAEFDRIDTIQAIEQAIGPRFHWSTFEWFPEWTQSEQNRHR